jgi:UDP-2,3-diacylglucosamine hydrolase
VAAPTIAALPVVHEFAAPPEWSRIDFVSDLHLASDMPITCEAWEEYLRATPADAVFILGDLFDAWIGDDARHQGFEARCAAVLARAASRCRVAFMAGNRDFLVGKELLDACGVMALPDPIVLLAFGQRVLLSHGDALCLSDTAYQRYREQVRSPQWQAAALALPLDERRRMAARMRHASEQRNANGEFPPASADVYPAAALAWMHQTAAQVLVHGHTHRPGSAPMAPGHLRHVLSDWDLDHAGTRPRAEVLRFTRGGFARLSHALAMRPSPTS